MSSKKTILVIDDDEPTRDVVGILIEKLGHAPLLCVSGKEALRTIETADVSLALVDIMMPEMNGYEVVKKLRESPRFGEKPIIMITAKTTEDDVYSGYKSGADYYLTKPFTAKQLEESIRLYL